MKGEDPIFIKRGTPVAFSPYGMHRRKEYFGDRPCEFVPERWDSLRVRWEYVPFSGGSRVCLGRE
jgi:cytochrome P450